MDSYVKGVIKDRDAKDLAETRQQIATCFEKVDCYLLTHPGFEVTKKKYDGDPNKIEPTFVKLLDRYCKKVFNSEVRTAREAKRRSACGNCSFLTSRFALRTARTQAHPRALPHLPGARRIRQGVREDVQDRVGVPAGDDDAGGHCRGEQHQRQR